MYKGKSGYGLLYAILIITSFIITTNRSMCVDAHAIIHPQYSDTSKIEVYRLTVYGENLSLSDFSPTISVIIEVPKGFTIVEIFNISGWTYKLRREDNIEKIIWDGYLPIGRSVDLIFKARNPDKGGEYEFRVYQKSLIGTIILWNEWSYSGVHGASYLTVKIISRSPGYYPYTSTSLLAIELITIISLITLALIIWRRVGWRKEIRGILWFKHSAPKF
mgnify:CR=1 FL=1|jgi:uncharacterized protein YcnI